MSMDDLQKYAEKTAVNKFVDKIASVDNPPVVVANVVQHYAQNRAQKGNYATTQRFAFVAAQLLPNVLHAQSQRKSVHTNIYERLWQKMYFFGSFPNTREFLHY